MGLALSIASIFAVFPALGADEPGAGDRVARALLCMEALDYTCASQEVDAALSAERELPEPARGALRLLAAEVALSLGDATLARDRLSVLLDEDPLRPAPANWPPAWRDELERVRAERPDREAPRIEGTLPSELPAGKLHRFSVRILDRSPLREARLHVRAGVETLAIPLALGADHTFEATLPAALMRAPAIHLWVEAWDVQGNQPGRWGSSEEPWSILVVAAPPPTERPLVESWRLWTVVGVGVAAIVAGIAVGVALSPHDEPPPTRVEGRLVWPR